MELDALQFIWVSLLGGLLAWWIILRFEGEDEREKEEARKKREFWERLNSDGKPK